MADRAKRHAAELAHAFGDRVRRLIDLARLLIEHEMIIAKMRPGDVPMKILRLDIEREEVGKQLRQSRGNLLARRPAQIRRSQEPRRAAALCARGADAVSLPVP